MQDWEIGKFLGIERIPGANPSLRWTRNHHRFAALAISTATRGRLKVFFYLLQQFGLGNRHTHYFIIPFCIYEINIADNLY